MGFSSRDSRFQPSRGRPVNRGSGISGFFLVLVMMADPVRQVAAGRLVAALGGDVEESVDRADVFGTAGEHRISMEDLAGLVLGEDAESGQFVAHIGLLFEIVECLAAGLVGLGEGDVVVEVEVVAVRRHPLEGPAHALVEGRDLRAGRARDRDQHDVVVDQVDQRAVELVGAERAADAAFLPVRSQHEMLDDAAGCGRRTGR